MTAAAESGRGVPTLLERWVERGLLLGFGLAVLLTFRDYGLTWDEPNQMKYGELVLAYFRSGFADKSCNEFQDLRFYGPLFESVAAAAYQSTGLPKADVRHLLNAATGLLTVLGVMRIARLFERPWLPSLAGLALALWPRFYGHSFNNSKDIPFACAFCWAMWAMARYRIGARRLRDAAWVGLAIGIALAVRPGGVLLLAFLPLALWPRAEPVVRQSPVLWAALIVAIAWTTMVLPWPWAHESPIGHPLLAIARSADIPSERPVLFEGQLLLENALPRYYLPKYLLITTPPFCLILLALGLPVAWRAGPVGRLTLAWLLLPIGFVVARRPPLYDEIRHFLFLLPAGALLAALGADAARGAASTRFGRWGLGVALLLLEPLPRLVSLHPYQASYFNLLAGGGDLSLRYDTDYWLSSYREAILWIDALGPPREGRRRVLVAAPPGPAYCASYYAAPFVEVVPLSEVGLSDKLPQEFDAYVATSRWFLHRAFADVPIRHVIAREGMLFAVVRSRDAPPEGGSKPPP